MKIINTETASTMTKSLKLLTWSSSSPPISNRYPARHLSLQLLELWTRRFHDFRSESPVSRHRRHSDGPKLIARTHLFSLHSVFDRRYLPHVYLLRPFSGIDVEILEIAELRALFHAQFCDYRNLLIAFAQGRDLTAGHRRLRRHRDIVVGQPGIVGAFGISLEMNCKTLLAPIVPNTLSDRRFLQDIVDTIRITSERTDVLSN